jgi:hypothetical protein
MEARFAGSDLAEDDGFSRTIKIGSTTSFGRAVKPSASFRKILWHVKDRCSMKEILVCKIHGYFSQSFSFFATRCLLVTARELWKVNQE